MTLGGQGAAAKHKEMEEAANSKESGSFMMGEMDERERQVIYRIQ